MSVTAPIATVRPRLDLDAMCTQAQQRLAIAVALAAHEARRCQFAESRQIRTRLLAACTRHSLQATMAIAWIDLHPALARLERALADQPQGTYGGLASAAICEAIAKGYHFNPIGYDFGKVRQ